MKVTVFGATGAIGSLTVNELLDRGHSVTAYARSLAKVPATWEGKVRIIIGELSDANAIDSAIAGTDVVISALGPSMDRKATGTPITDGTVHIIRSMKTHAVTRFIGHATPAVHDPDEKTTAITRLASFLPRTFMPNAYREVTGMYEAVANSSLRWTIVRFLAPNNSRKQERLRVGFFGKDTIGFRVSRANIAAFTAEQVDSSAFIGRAPAISN